MTKRLNTKGSAVITAIGLGAVLLFVIASVHTFTSYRTQTVVQESKKVKALALAEAGLELVLGELYNNSSFATHEVKIEEENLKWGNAINRENTLDDNTDYSFSVENDSSGTLSGTLGDGEFKVRVGNIPYEDDESTKTIDEKKAYIFIESMGIYKDTVRKVTAVVNRRFPTREFLMYDGGVLSMIYGQTDKDNTNYFATGHLYGHKGVEIGRISMKSHQSDKDGTKQELEDISAILSGDGGIYIYSDTKAKFKNRSGSELDTTIKQNTTYPTNGTYPNNNEEYGEMCSELDGTTPEIPEELSNWMKDKNSGISIPPNEPAFEEYKKKAGNGNYPTCKYKVHSGWSEGCNGLLDVVYLDFGSNIREREVEVPDSGIIYSDKDIVIKGNPKKDVTIVSEKNVFIAGDFNQAGKGNIEQRYGFPQNYDNNEIVIECKDYCQNSRDLYKEDVEAANGDFKYHVSATVIAKERIVYDHRSPVDCCENEIVPILKYELAKEIAVGDSGNGDPKLCLSPSTTTSLVIKATDTIDGFKESIEKFANNYKISNVNKLQEKLGSIYNGCGGSFDDKALHELTLEAWKVYVEDFNSDTKGELSSSGKDENHGIYKLLQELLKEVGERDASPDDYLYFPEMSTNGMFVSCGKMNNTCYAGPDVNRYYDEIGFTNMGIPRWYTMTSLVHRVYGSETNMRFYDVTRHPQSSFNYIPPTRKKIYDETMPLTVGNNSIEITGYVVLSWQEFAANQEDYSEF